MKRDQLSADIEFSIPLPFDLDQGSYLQLLNSACNNQAIQRIVLSFPCHCNDPLSWFDAIYKRYDFRFYWEKPVDSYTIAAVGSISTIKSQGSQRFKNISDSVSEIEQTTLHIDLTNGKSQDTPLVGGFSFFDELKDSKTWRDFEPASFTLPEYSIRQTLNRITATVAVPIDKSRNIDNLHKEVCSRLQNFLAYNTSDAQILRSNPTPTSSTNTWIPEDHRRHRWFQLINDAKESISQRKLNKVVLGRQLNLPVSRNYDAVKTLQALRSTYPKCSTFLFKNGKSNTFIGSSPEQLVSIKNNELHTEALAGSIGRGSTSQQDKTREKQLLKSLKNNEEHNYVLSDIKRLVAPFVTYLESADQPIIKKLANVQHLYSPIRGELKENATGLSILEELHPTPAVGGTPRQEALKYIKNYEPFERGWFAAPIGWITTGGEADFSVAIRSGLISDDSALLFAGCGIVADSDAEKEWQETNLKFMPMLSALNYD